MIKFHLSCKCGLGNRINSLVSLFRIQKYNSFEFGIHWNGKLWPQKNLLPCEFNELFDNDIPLANISETTMVATRLLHTFPGEPEVDALYHRTPEAIKQDYVECFRKLIPVKTIQDKVQHEINRMGRPFVGMYIRSGEDWDHCGNTRALEAYFERMKGLEDYPIYVSAHTPEITAEVVKRFGNRVYYQEDKREGHIPDIFTEMLVLGQAEHLVVDCKSSFACCAWYFGEAKAKVRRVL